jgi:hypothetical protein
MRRSIALIISNNFGKEMFCSHQIPDHSFALLGGRYETAASSTDDRHFFTSLFTSVIPETP